MSGSRRTHECAARPWFRSSLRVYSGLVIDAKDRTYTDLIHWDEILGGLPVEERGETASVAEGRFRCDERFLNQP
jgi:hypothetical protein